MEPENTLQPQAPNHEPIVVSESAPLAPVEITPTNGLEGFETGRSNYFFPEHMYSVEAGSLGEASRKLTDYLATMSKPF